MQFHQMERLQEIQTLRKQNPQTPLEFLTFSDISNNGFDVTLYLFNRFSETGFGNTTWKNHPFASCC